jgi:hypothetical protein
VESRKEPPEWFRANIVGASMIWWAAAARVGVRNDSVVLRNQTTSLPQTLEQQMMINSVSPSLVPAEPVGRLEHQELSKILAKIVLRDS